MLLNQGLQSSYNGIEHSEVSAFREIFPGTMRFSFAKAWRRADRGRKRDRGLRLKEGRFRRKTVASESTPSCIIAEIRRAHLWRTLGKCDAFDRPTPGTMEPGHCQRVRTDFARQIFGKLFVGGYVRI